MNDDLPVQTPAPGVNRAADFTVFMRSYQDMVFSTAARITANDAQAEDIAQEVFLRAYRDFTHLSASPSAGGWLKTVATNLALNHVTRYRRRWRFFSEFRRDGDHDGSETPEAAFPSSDDLLADVDANERRRMVDAALARLPDHQRVPLVLFHFEDMSYDEIARRMSVSLPKLKTDLMRGRAALARLLVTDPGARETLRITRHD
jgi:RNA polymerase sigma-70 factor (ECF subfamily)